MAEPSSRKVQDTTLYRIAKDVGFNARVEPFWHTYARLGPRMGFLEKWREKRRLRRIAGGVNAELRAAKVVLDGWDERTGDCVCNLRVARIGLIKEFKTFVQNAVEAEDAKKWPHLFALRDRPCLIVPVDFPLPVHVDPGGGEEELPVASSVRAHEELAAVNERLRIDERFAIKKMVDYLDATERDIGVYESRFGTAEGFWAKFCFVLLRKLAEVSVSRRLPVILA